MHISPDTRTAPPKTPRKAALASFLGSTLEYYDFFIYGTAAALVFPHLFFPSDDPAVGLIGALATFGVAYVARPVGGLVMGHFGDKLGRKRILLLTLGIMGLASLGIGCLPTYDQVGVWAPILLVAGRLAQGFSAGAESAGASTLTLEHSPDGKRAFFTSFVMMGYASGMVLATLVFIPVSALPQDAMMSWGWRVPFWLSIVVLAVAYWVRTHLDETPVFEEAQEQEQVAPMPVKEVLKFQAPDVLRVAGMSIMVVMQTVFTVFGLAYATSTAGFDRSSILTVNAVAIGLSMLVMPLAATLADRIGRRPLLLAAAIGCSATIFVYFLALSSGNIVLVFLAAFLNMTVLYSAYNAVWPAYVAEQFATPVRYTGMALGNQLGLVLAGFAPMIASMLLTPGLTGWMPVAVFATVCMLIAGVCVFYSRETYRTPIESLGAPYLEGTALRREQHAAAKVEAGLDSPVR
ncbi:MFS transporter [Pseudarthrobacter defluvii]|jgi:MFS family permease|uniref:MFS transporter n=1 Tax=Pseudarthrobacter defluvii TaxID=410837 RepID=UPI0025781365|nr:MFS transporter [Pseudarthrobacter defluvii]WJH26030.1 MHS family MFS transporter [Pseudarthrobacter defluvii]